jgi:type IV pilus assembly protein PilB
MASRIPLGELLVEAQIITREQLDEVLALQRSDGRRLGVLLMEAGLVTETQVTQILSQQLSVPWVSLYHIDFSRQLLNLVPRDLAERYCLVPIFVRRVRGIGEALYVAMDDPSDESAQQEVSQYSGLPVRAMIAPPADIRAAIRVYYGAGSDSASLSEAVAAELREQGSEPPRHRERREVHPPESTEQPEGEAAEALEPPSPSEAVAEQPAPPHSEPRPVSEQAPAPDSGPEISAREIRMPAPKRGRGAKMITLTLLDGTQINLPAKGGAKPDPDAPAAAEVLTARDLIAALRATSHGADAKDVLGDNVRWEAMFAALLAVLLRKHLIADWEFVEEYKKV